MSKPKYRRSGPVEIHCPKCGREVNKLVGSETRLCRRCRKDARREGLTAATTREDAS